jgi:hypothetical protein
VGGCSEQPLILGFDRAVGSVREIYQTLAVAYEDVAAFRPNVTKAFEYVGGHRDARTAAAQHRGHKIVGEHEFLADTVLAHQEPASETLLHRVGAVRMADPAVCNTVM